MQIDYKQWLDNEYTQWVKALQECTVHNFKEHPVVLRMIGNFSGEEFVDIMKNEGVKISVEAWGKLIDIDSVGAPGKIRSGPLIRMIYYANKVLQLNPTSIVEIGGGVGEFYAILRALGYTGDYYIFDLPEVKKFQNKYLKEVEKQTGLTLKQKLKYEFCVSFYAIGEFDDDLKAWHINNVVKKCEHGFIIWNAHSGASEDINFSCTIEDENPLTGVNNKQLTW